MYIKYVKFRIDRKWCFCLRITFGLYKNHRIIPI